MHFGLPVAEAGVDVAAGVAWVAEWDTGAVAVEEVFVGVADIVDAVEGMVGTVEV